MLRKTLSFISVLLPFLPMEFEEVDTLPETVRGEGGFGSTGR